MSEEFEMYHDKQVWVIMEDTHNGSTGVQGACASTVSVCSSTSEHHVSLKRSVYNLEN